MKNEIKLLPNSKKVSIEKIAKIRSKILVIRLSLALSELKDTNTLPKKFGAKWCFWR